LHIYIYSLSLLYDIHTKERNKVDYAETSISEILCVLIKK